MEDDLQSGYYKSPLGYDKVHWFVNEVTKLENEMAFFFKKTEKDIIMAEKDEEDYRNKNIFRFYEKEIFSEKVGDHCHLTAKNRNPAHSKCNINVTNDNKIKVILFHLYFTLFPITIVMCSSRN